MTFASQTRTNIQKKNYDKVSQKSILHSVFALRVKSTDGTAIEDEEGLKTVAGPLEHKWVTQYAWKFRNM